MTDQLGYRLDYDYDAVGRLRSITNSAGTRIVLYEYDAAGRTGAQDPRQRRLYHLHLRPRRPVAHPHQRPARPFRPLVLQLHLRLRGRRTAMATHYGAWTYEYDDLGQLTHAVLASTDPQIPNQDLRYEYDAMGNRVRTMENG